MFVKEKERVVMGLGKKCGEKKEKIGQEKGVREPHGWITIEIDCSPTLIGKQ